MCTHICISTHTYVNTPHACNFGSNQTMCMYSYMQHTFQVCTSRRHTHTIQHDDLGGKRADAKGALVYATYVCVCIYIYVYTHTHISRHTTVHTHTIQHDDLGRANAQGALVYAIYVCVCVCVYIYMYIYIYIYLFTHTHLDTQIYILIPFSTMTLEENVLMQKVR